MIVVILYVNVIFYDFCHNKIKYMFVIVYLLFVFANELLINALWRGKQKGKKFNSIQFNSITDNFQKTRVCFP